MHLNTDFDINNITVNDTVGSASLSSAGGLLNFNTVLIAFLRAILAGNYTYMKQFNHMQQINKAIPLTIGIHMTYKEKKK